MSIDRADPLAKREPSDLGQGAVAALRRFVRREQAPEVCELCGLPLSPMHQHLFNTADRQLLCCCDACAVLFDARQKYRRVPRLAERLVDFRLDDTVWAGLYIPIDLAFFFIHSGSGRVTALYPSPAGATESLLSLEAWKLLVAANPWLAELQPDVEALLVNRVGTKRDCYRVSIDRCFELVGLIRAHWRGLSGGSKVWEEIGRFFDALTAEARARTEGGAR